MGITDFIYKYAPLRISIPLALHITIIGGIIYISRQEAWVSFAIKVNDALPIVLIAAAATLLYLVLIVSYIVLCSKFRKNLRPKFGVLWDKNKEPYCPIHEKPLSRYKAKGQIAGLDCPGCGRAFHLITDDGKRLTLEEAKDKFNSPTSRSQYSFK